MAWPRGLKKGKRNATLAEALANQEQVEPVEHPILSPDIVANQRAQLKKSAPKPERWKMRAGNNWDTAVEGESSADRFHVPSDLFPEGMDLLWVSEAVRGDYEVTKQRKNGFFRTGWTQVHATDFDGRFGSLFPQDDGGYIRLEGMILCARPLAISQRAKVREERKAREAIALKEAAFRGGEINATGANHPSALAVNRINRTMERVEIPKD